MGVVNLKILFHVDNFKQAALAELLKTKGINGYFYILGACRMSGTEPMDMKSALSNRLLMRTDLALQVLPTNPIKYKTVKNYGYKVINDDGTIIPKHDYPVVDAVEVNEIMDLRSPFPFSHTNRDEYELTEFERNDDF